MTYVQLTALLQSYLENSETGFVADIPQIVQQCESRIYNSVRTPDQRQTVTNTVAVQTFAAPAGFVESQGMYITVSGEPTPLLQKQASFIRTVFGTATGTPLYYALQTAGYASTTVMLGPTPNATFTYRLDYFGNPTSIVTASETWVSVHFPEALLYGSLLEGYIYMKGEQDQLGVFKARFEEAIALLRRSAEGLALEDEYRSPPIMERVGV